MKYWFVIVGLDYVGRVWGMNYDDALTRARKRYGILAEIA